MKAVEFSQFGGPEVLTLRDMPKPVIKEGEVLIKVVIAGVNPIDCKIREGSSFAASTLILPAQLGFDVCGEVVESQVEFDLLKKGDVVFGLVGLYDKPQAYSEYCIGTLSDVVLKPAELSLEEAGALPMVGLTAWQAVMEHGRCEQGQRVLVHAAAGGVGHLAVQFAKSEGAYVIATATAKDHAYLKSIGVDECIDYSEVAFENSVKDMDLIIDLVGGETALRSFACLAPNGRLVTVPTVTRDVILKKASEVGVDATGMKMQLKPKDLIDIGERVASKKLHINIAAKYALADAKEAHIAMSESRHAGKYILQCTQARLL